MPAARQRRWLVQGTPKEVPRFCGIGDPGAVLGEQLPACSWQATDRSVQDIDRPSVGYCADVLVDRPDGQIGQAVIVEVVEEDPPGQGAAEAVARLGGAQQPRAALDEELVAAAQPGGRPVQDVDRPGVHPGADVLGGGADRKIPRTPGVKEPGRQGGPEPVARFGGAAGPRTLHEALARTP